MATITTLTKWGHSEGLRIPANIVKHLKLRNGQKIKITVNNDQIIVIPVNKQPNNLKELFSNYHGKPIHDHEKDWGEPKGRELKW